MDKNLSLSFKVVLVGDSGVGKTSIAMRGSLNEFDLLTNETVGSAQFQIPLQINNKKIIIHLWDTAGQEKYASLVPMYSKGASIALIVASLDNEETIEHMEYWNNVINNIDINIPLFFIINKINLFQSNYTEKINYIKNKFKNKISTFYFVSAKNGTGLKELFQEIGLTLLNNQSIKSDQPLIINKKKFNF